MVAEGSQPERAGRDGTSGDGRGVDGRGVDGRGVDGRGVDGSSGDGSSGDGSSVDGPSVDRRARVELSDPRALRAMAHPTRLALVGLLRREGPLTATQAAAYVGESPSSCSFHLRQLEKWGLVEEAGGGRGRERPWKATAEVTSWRRASVQGDTGAARTALDRVLAQRYLDQIVAWFERRSDEPQEWLELSGLGDWVLYLTPAELKELEDDIDRLVERYAARSTNRSARPAGSRQVTFIHALLPEGGPP